MSDVNKVLIIGNEKCGKTSLIFSFFTDNLPDPAVPTIYKEYKTEMDVEGKKVPLEIWIAPVQEHYSQIRPLSYDDTKVVILCFAVDNPDSLTDAIEKWHPEIMEHLPNAPVVLVANKIDLRTDENVINLLAEKSLIPISNEQGKEAADRLKVFAYLENSAKACIDVGEVFKTAASAVLKSG